MGVHSLLGEEALGCCGERPEAEEANSEEILAIFSGWSIEPRSRSWGDAPPASRAHANRKVLTKHVGSCTPKCARTDRWVNLQVRNTKAAG